MQALESTLSLLAFCSILLAALEAAGASSGPDDSLYRMQLANAAWRVLYLRGDFRDFGPGRNAELERDMDEITRQTSLCVFLEGIRSTSCRGGAGAHMISVTAGRTLIEGGAPRSVSFSLGN